jgi:hypothetical protein
VRDIIQDAIRQFGENPIYRVILFFMLTAFTLLLVEMFWLTIRAIIRTRLNSAHFRFDEQLAPRFYSALDDLFELEEWLTHGRRFPEETLRRFLEPRILSTTGELRKKIIAVYVQVGLLELDLKRAHSRFWHNRMLAMRRLAFVAGPEHQALLLKLGQDSHALKVLAALALGRIGSPEFVVKVFEDMELPRRLMEQPIHTMLKQMDGDRFEALMEHWGAVHSPTIRKILMQVAATKAPGTAAHWFGEAENDETLEVRMGVASAAGQMATEESLVLLLRLLQDPDFEVRAAAARALGKRRELTTLENLAEAMHDSAFWVRQNAAAAMTGMGRLGLERLQEIVADSDDKYAADSAQQELERHRIFEQQEGGTA